MGEGYYDFIDMLEGDESNANIIKKAQEVESKDISGMSKKELENYDNILNGAQSKLYLRIVGNNNATKEEKEEMQKIMDKISKKREAISKELNK